MNGKSLEHFTLRRIDKEDAHYNVIFGMRSNGKSFAVEERGLKKYIESGGKEQMAIIRRYDVDLQGKKGADVFSHFVNNPEKGNMIAKMTHGEWTDVYCYSRRWYLCRWENDKRLVDSKPFCFGFTLAGMEHDKSLSFPGITTILFDEFMTRQFYLIDEFVTFTNVLSTIIRDRDNVRIYMCGNTVNKYNPYFKEMGLNKVLQMEPGDIQVYKFAALHGKVLKIAVEYADNPNPEGKPSDVYFAFNNPKLQMITNGIWELAIYPRLPYKYKRENVLFEFYIKWEEEVIHCELINVEDEYFIFAHAKTTEITEKEENSSVIYSTEYNPNPHYRRRITVPNDDLDRKLYGFFKREKVFYQDNDIGEVVRNYLQWCTQDKGFV